MASVRKGRFAAPEAQAGGRACEAAEQPCPLSVPSASNALAPPTETPPPGTLTANLPVRYYLEPLPEPDLPAIPPSSAPVVVPEVGPLVDRQVAGWHDGTGFAGPVCNHGAKVATEYQRRAGDRVRPDWVRITLLAVDPDVLCACLGLVFGRSLARVDRGRGLLGFEQSADFVGAEGQSFARYAWGGEAMRGRAMVEISGAACEAVRDWSQLVSLAEGNAGRLTRLDLCLDTEAVCVDEVVSAWRAGEFNGRGRPPSATLVDDMGSGRGRTFYVGRRGADCCLRAYEKGKQLGQAASKWVRLEVELLAKSTALPLAAMLDGEALFAGAYRYLASLVGTAGTRPERVVRAAQVVLGRAVEIARQQVGGVVGFLTQRAGWSVAEVVRFLRRSPSVRISASVPDDPEWRSVCRWASVEPVPVYEGEPWQALN